MRVNTNKRKEEVIEWLAIYNRNLSEILSRDNHDAWDKSFIGSYTKHIEELEKELKTYE